MNTIFNINNSVLVSEFVIRALNVTETLFWFDGNYRLLSKPLTSSILQSLFNPQHNTARRHPQVQSQQDLNLLFSNPEQSRSPFAAIAGMFSCLNRCCSSLCSNSFDQNGPLVANPTETDFLVVAQDGPTERSNNAFTQQHAGNFRQLTNVQLIQQSLIELPDITPENFEELNALELLIDRADENDDLWLPILMDIVVAIPLGNPLSEPVIAIIIDQLPNPSRGMFVEAAKAVLTACNELSTGITRGKPEKSQTVKMVTQLRNLLVMLGVLAEKYAGPMSTSLFTEGLGLALLELLRASKNPLIQLHAAVTLEKFAKTGANKQMLMRLNADQILVKIEDALCSSDGAGTRKQNKGTIVDEYRRCQTGFCVMWALDNVFPCDGRKYSVERLDLSGVNVMLDVKDATKHLKLAPDGLEIRNDALSFESVRATCCARGSGKWYFEVTLFTCGIMQIGWATDRCAYQSEQGVGIGDDPYSFAYDGCRKLLWHDQQNLPTTHPKWKQGDVLGALLDLDKQEMTFSLNGKFMKSVQKMGVRPDPSPEYYKTAPFYPAASLMTFQHAMFNFGNAPYKYPPAMNFRSLNETGSMTDEEKKIVPRLVVLEQLRQEHDVDSNVPTCVICYDHTPSVELLPCKHDEFCNQCSQTLDKCPLCRTPIEQRVPLKHV